MTEASFILLLFVAIRNFTLVLSTPFCNVAKSLLVDQFVECGM